MDQKELLARAKNRRRLVHLAQETEDDIAAEIGTYWLQELARNWNPENDPNVPPGIPVGYAFDQYVDDWVKRSKHRARRYDWYVKNLVKEVAHWINTNDMRLTGKDYPNPLNGVEKRQEDGYRVKAASTKQAETVYGPVLHEDRHRNMYATPDEHPRTCPEHPGANLKRISDGVFQCMSDGEHYNIEGGHEVTFERGVHNQTNPGWNESWPQPAFLSKSQQSWEDPELVSYGKDKETADPDRPYPDQESDPSDPQEQWTDVAPSEYGGFDGREGGESNTEASIHGFVKRAQQATYEVTVDDHVFGPAQVQTRYCPDHGEINLYRIADKVYQCPLDRKVYNFEQGFTKENGEVNTGGSVANMTPDRPGYYSSGFAFIAAQKGVKGLSKEALSNIDNRFAFDLSHALAGDASSRRLLELVVEGVVKNGKDLRQAIRDAYMISEQPEMPAAPEKPAPVSEPAVAPGAMV